MSDRQNAQGSPCPPWCVTDHARVGPDGHGSRITEVSVPGKRSGLNLPDKFLVSGWQRDGYAPEVMIAAMRYGRDGEQDPDMVLDLRLAGRLAGLAEMLATATPEQHRELAAAIRSAAALIAGEDADQEPGREGGSDDN